MAWLCSLPCGHLRLTLSWLFFLSSLDQGNTTVDLKNSPNLKVESCVLFGGNLLDFKPKRSHFSSPERAALRKWVEEPSYKEVLQKRAGSLNIRRLSLMKEIQIFQVEEFSAFLCMGRYKSLVSLKLFLSNAFQLSWASVLHFFTTWAPLGLTIESGCNLMAARWARIFLFPEYS